MNNVCKNELVKCYESQYSSGLVYEFVVVSVLNQDDFHLWNIHQESLDYFWIS